MNRRTLTVNRIHTPSRRRSDSRPTCPSTHSGTRCVLDPDHCTKHFAAGQEWDDETKEVA